MIRVGPDVVLVLRNQKRSADGDYFLSRTNIIMSHVVDRFAESGGHEVDRDRAGSHLYRDWVIKALNADAVRSVCPMANRGRSLEAGRFRGRDVDRLLVAGPYPGQTTSKTIQLIRYNHLDDMASTLGSGMLGLTIGCARCHDHKYGPIPQTDYYRLIANLARVDSLAAKHDPASPLVFLPKSNQPPLLNAPAGACSKI